jgi:hypothetical protein
VTTGTGCILVTRHEYILNFFNFLRLVADPLLLASDRDNISVGSLNSHKLRDLKQVHSMVKKCARELTCYENNCFYFEDRTLNTRI